MINSSDCVFSRHRRSGTYIPICREVAPGDEYFPSSSGEGIHHVGRHHVSSSSADRWRLPRLPASAHQRGGVDVG